MKKLGLIVVIVAVVAMGRLSSDTSRVSAKESASTTPVVIAHANPAPVPLMHSSPSRAQQAPLGSVAVVDPVLPVPEPASLLLLGSGLISVGVLIRRRLRSSS